MTKRFSIGCALCSHTIFQTDEKERMNDALKGKNQNSVRIIDRKGKELETGFLCDACAGMLSSQFDPLKKILKVATRAGNSAHVLLPHHWEGEKVIAYLMRAKGE